LKFTAVAFSAAAHASNKSSYQTVINSIWYMQNNFTMLKKVKINSYILYLVITH